MTSSPEESRREQEQKVGLYALEQAQKCLSVGNDGKAFANFLLVFKLMPRKIGVHQQEFLECLSRWTKTLKEKGRLQDILTCQHEACQVMPGNAELLNSLGTELFQLGFVKEAASYFRRSLEADSNFVLARHNLENISGLVVERWHFRMLNDMVRNTRFQDAIQSAVQAGHKTVLDIGTGTGLLSMFAAEAGAERVYACEMSRPMYSVACDCVKANELDDKIVLFPNKSDELRVPEHIPERVSLVVTETFDAGLFGEHILSSLAHAWRELAQCSSPNKAKVIPCRAKTYVSAIECDYIRQKNRSVFPGVRHLSFDGVSIQSKSTDTAESSCCDPYTCHRLTDLPGGFKVLTEPRRTTDISFEDPQVINKYLGGVSDEFELTVNTQGQLDALAFWFDLDLDDTTTLSSNPRADSCWEQAVFPVVPSQLKDYPAADCSMLLREGDRIVFKQSCCQNVLNIACTEVIRKHDRSSPLGSQPVKFEEMKDTDTLTNHSPATTLTEVNLTPDEMSQLNNLSFNQICCQALEHHLQCLPMSSRSSTHSGHPGVSLLMLTKDFIVLPLQALNVGYQEVCVVTEEGDNVTDPYSVLCEANRINRSRLHMEHNLDNVCGTWEVIFADLVDPSGCLRPQILEDVALARMTCLSQGGIVIPNRVLVYGMLIDSESLSKDSCVTSDVNTLGLNVKDFINAFQMTHHTDVYLSTLPHTKLSEPFQLFDFDLDRLLPEDNKVESTFLHQDTTFTVCATDMGSVHAVVYWFDFCLSPNTRYSTLHSSSHIRQAALLQKRVWEVHEGKPLTVRAICKNSCFGVTVSL